MPKGVVRIEGFKECREALQELSKGVGAASAKGRCWRRQPSSRRWSRRARRFQTIRTIDARLTEGLGQGRDREVGEGRSAGGSAGR
jgi:hypothetical protein